MSGAEEKRWVLCPRCGAKTWLQIFRETELKAFPLFYRKCRRESVVAVKNFMMEVTRADALPKRRNPRWRSGSCWTECSTADSGSRRKS